MVEIGKILVYVNVTKMISINGTNRVKNNALWVFQDYGNRILLLSGKRVIKNSAKQSIVKSLLGFVMLVHSHCFA